MSSKLFYTSYILRKNQTRMVQKRVIKREKGVGVFIVDSGLIAYLNQQMSIAN